MPSLSSSMPNGRQPLKYFMGESTGPYSVRIPTKNREAVKHSMLTTKKTITIIEIVTWSHPDDSFRRIVQDTPTMKVGSPVQVNNAWLICTKTNGSFYFVFRQAVVVENSNRQIVLHEQT